MSMSMINQTTAGAIFGLGRASVFLDIGGKMAMLKLKQGSGPQIESSTQIGREIGLREA